MSFPIRGLLSLGFVLLLVDLAPAQSFQDHLATEGTDSLATAALRDGDAARGAIVFHQPQLACARCHAIGDLFTVEGAPSIGPILTDLPDDATDAHLVESILFPSRAIRRGFETITLETSSGETIVGLPLDEDDARVRLRHPTEGRTIEVPLDQIEQRSQGDRSMMPEGQIEQIGGRQQFLDLVRYLIEIRDGGPSRARELQPPDSLFAVVVPDYEAHVDHAGLIRSLDESAFDRGAAIYQRLCINCHGDREQPGSLPTAPRFATGSLRNGADPFSMYRTLTHGFGFMAPQTWMVPRQKYDVIHFVRESFFVDRIDGAYAATDDTYLQQLPSGDTFGPEPIETRPWADMDYGPSLINTYEIPQSGSATSQPPHIAYKGIAVRLDPGPGGVSRGSSWMLFDHELMSMAAAWTADAESSDTRFIDWNGIHFNGRHQIHPTLVGDVRVSHAAVGWADPATDRLDDQVRVLGRDGRRYGPLPRTWARYRGLYTHGDRSIIEYTIGETRVLEMPGKLANPIADDSSESLSPPISATERPTIFTRTLHVAPRPQPLRMAIATHPASGGRLEVIDNAARLTDAKSAANEPSAIRFDGRTHIEVSQIDDLQMASADFTISAIVRTTEDGTLVCRTRPEREWVPNGKTFFIRGGRLCYDIGWVGVVTSQDEVADGQWHQVALVWQAESGRARFYIDGRPSGGGVLRPAAEPEGEVLRIGYTAENFPDKSGFDGELRSVAFHGRALTAAELESLSSTDAQLRNEAPRPLALWPLDSLQWDESPSETIGKRPSRLIAGNDNRDAASAAIVAAISGDNHGTSWSLDPARPEILCLNLPAGDDPLQLTIAFTRIDRQSPLPPELSRLPTPLDLNRLLTPGPMRWPTTLEVSAPIVTEENAFRVETLPHPELNPWLALIRPTGLDFTADGRSLYVTTWDGDVWRVDGITSDDSPSESQPLRWRRIASGMFQPLGILVVDDVPYVTCRDQLVILRDRNGDGEIDHYECFNDDHQVTEHFHEFAMGLQRDEQGRFYYAKSARHALPAVVPHHGTLLRVAADGSTTQIVATGFRAANGVCLNPDGTFIVTDQEGHWNPKNRINWVREGGFYGNLFGYHDVTDPSDDAMEPPLCWITNVFDRSPAELLWVDAPSWGPLNGSLLNLSYGNGKVFIVPFERIGERVQGGMCELPMTMFPTGVMRGRFHADGSLYLCGMFAWAGNQTQAGGLYRIAPTGRPATVPLELHAAPDRITITLSDPVEPISAVDVRRYEVRVWGLRRSADYGSPHLDEHSLEVTEVQVTDEGRTIALTIPELAPTWGMEIIAQWIDCEGVSIRRTIHNSIHELVDPPTKPIGR